MPRRSSPHSSQAALRSLYSIDDEIPFPKLGAVEIEAGIEGLRHRTGPSVPSTALDPAGRAVQPSFPPSLTETGAVAQPREFDVAYERVAEVESHDLSGFVPSEAQDQAGKQEGVAINWLEYERLAGCIVSAA